MAVTPLLARKRDVLWLVYFCIHLPVMFAIDLQTLYPASLVPTPLRALKDYHIANNQDLFFVSPPPFFAFYMWMELFFHVPICLWAVGALWRDDPRSPLVLLVYAVQTFVTTATCMADYASWSTIDFAAKMKLTSLYGPYIAVSILMGVDASVRIARALRRSSAESATRSKND